MRTLALAILLVASAAAVSIPPEVHNFGENMESLVEMEAREGRFKSFQRCVVIPVRSQHISRSNR
jgi:uncharacterized membrane protein SpoIIM required for sporulation